MSEIDKTYDVILSRHSRDAVIIATESNTRMYEKNTQIAHGLTMDEAWAVTRLVNAGNTYE